MTRDVQAVGTARLLSHAAADADRRGYPFAGVMRVAARMLLELPSDTADDACAGCGQPIEQPPTGRRRKWCRESCRSRARRR